MNKLGKSLVLGLVSSGALISWEFALAQTATQSAGSENDTLETVIVTAEKREERLQDVPMSVSVLGGNELEKQQDRDFADFAAMIPGLSLMSSGPGITQLTLRGQNAGGDGSTVAVYLDESPIGSSSALLNGAILSGDLDTWDMQRIEVLRGPQGTLYGASSEGGLLKFVTNAPVLGSFSGAVEASGEEVQDGGNDGDVRGMVNIPLGSRAALRVSAFDQDLAGYIDDPLSGAKNVNSGHKDGGRASLLFDATDDFSIRLTAMQQETKTNGNPAVDVNPLTLAPVVGDLSQDRYYSEPNYFKYENYNATINWKTGPVNIVSTTSYGVLNSDQVIDATSTVIAPGLTLGAYISSPEVFDENLGSYEDNNADLEKFTQEIRISSSIAEQIDWQLGGYYTHEQGALDQHLNIFAIPGDGSAGLPSLEVVSLDSTYEEWAGFGNVTYHFGPQFDLQAGGRWSTNKQSAVENLSGLLVGPPQAYDASSKGNVFTYSVAPSWKPDPSTTVYARLATGFRPGGPNVLPPDTVGVPKEYGSDKTTNIELGVKSTQADGRVSVDLAVFHVDWKNIQLLEYVDSYGVNGNGGTARSEGLEADLKIIPVRGLTFTWTGAYTDAVLTSPAPAVNGVSGDPMPFSPKWSTAIDGEYDWAAFSDYNAFVGATWSYIGTRSTDFASSAAAAPAQATLPSYNTFAARLGLQSTRYLFELYGKNLSNSRGITNYVSSGAPNLAGEINVIQPLTIGVTASMKF
ncbi:MAG: TonB-dependent receptor [Steroidobacteraceae bacterium]|jgi:outer membrane receptor protein involved in Fe transport